MSYHRTTVPNRMNWRAAIVNEHLWGGSGFASTDLDFLLKQHGIVTIAELIAAFG